MEIGSDWGGQHQTVWNREGHRTVRAEKRWTTDETDRIRVKRDHRLVRLADSAGFSQPQQYFSLTRNQPAIQPTVFSSHTKSASQPASQPAEQGN